MAKRDLSAMLKEGSPNVAAEGAKAFASSQDMNFASSEVAKSGESEAPAGPRFTSFAPKTARLRPAQIEGLRDATLRLKAARSAKDERITDNTLLRIAVDLLLEKHQNDLAGSTEAELRASVGLNP